MNTQTFFDFFDVRKNRYKMYYSLLFIGFGVLITLLTSYAAYRIHIMDMESGLTRAAALEVKNKQEQGRRPGLREDQGIPGGHATPVSR